MNAENQAIFRKRLLDVLANNGGRQTLAQLRLANVIPPLHVRAVMQGLFDDHLVLREGELYSLPPKQPQESLNLQVNSASGTPARKFEGEVTRRCLRCEIEKFVSEFERPGLVRAARICNECDANGTKKPEAGTNPAPRETPTPQPGTVDEPRDTSLVESASNELHISVDNRVREYLERLVRTGLFGDSITECAEILVWSGIEQRLPLIAKVLT